jgi:hypothetical protein
MDTSGKPAIYTAGNIITHYSKTAYGNARPSERVLPTALLRRLRMRSQANSLA